MSSHRKRHYASDDDEDEGRISTGEEEEEGEIRHKRSNKKSKKHKKDKRHKSKRRRRRSSTPDDNDRATDREGGSTPDVEAGEVVEISDEEGSRSRTSKRPRSNSRSRRVQRRSRSRSSSRRNSPVLKRERSDSPPVIKNEPLKIDKSSSQAVFGETSKDSLSIEETNKLRASIGLPPLKVNSGPPKKEEEADRDGGKEGTLIPNSDNVRHKPAEDITAKSEAAKLRERLAQRREKRKQEAKLLTVSTLGAASDDVDNTAKWLEKQKRKAKEKKAAERRAKMLEELDEDFGVNNLVQNEKNKQKSDLYQSQNLAGLRVEHDSSQFQDGKSVILTLKDAEILDDDATDTLVNVNMMDAEKVEKNKEMLKKAKSGGYNPYDQEEVDQETGELRRKNMLDKYDEELDGEKKKSFVIGAQGTFNEDEERELNRARIRQKLAKKNVESLEMPQLKQASDYYTEEEVVKFKKPKKKKKVKRKMLKADDLLGLEQPETDTKIKREDLSSGSKGALPMDLEEMDVKPQIDDVELSRVKLEEDDDLDLQLALRKARRLKQRKRNVQEEDDHAAKLIEAIKDEPIDVSTGAEFIQTFDNEKLASSNIILNETSEFCRSLASRSYEGTGLGDSVHQDIRDFENSLTSRSKVKNKHKKHTADLSDEEPMDISDFYKGQGHGDDEELDEEEEAMDSVILDEEPNLQSGIANAIKLATNKGYWEVEESKSTRSKLKHLEARNYTIEDKGGSDDRHSRRGGDRYGSSGSSQPFQEKSDYKPNVKLEYIDDDGRMLNQKEAFRHLSHKFHGKGSGKLKTEKRVKKIQEESLMRNMSSTDTPLNTLEKLRQRQREASTPYVILSGNKVQATDLRK